MATTDNIVLRPELASRFAETEDLVFRDGRRVTAAEVWRFMTEEAPRLFPRAFNADPYAVGNPRLSQDQELFGAIKRAYLQMTIRSFVEQERQKGKRVALAHHNQSTELYHAAGLFPLNVSFANLMTKNSGSGKAESLLEGGQKWVSHEACNGLVTLNWAIQQSEVPVDYVTPFLCTYCSDMAYVADRHRSGARKMPLRFVRFPVGAKDKEWAVDYLSEDLRSMAGELGRLSGHPVTEEGLQEEIRLHNLRKRELRGYFTDWWKAAVPPTTGLDNTAISIFSNDYPDPVAIHGLLRETRREIGRRIRKGALPEGVAEDAARIYTHSGGVLANLVDRSGGVLVGDDSGEPVIVREKGDPYENLARSYIQTPAEWPTEERAHWVADRVRRSRAAGAIFTFYWGCNNTSAAVRMTADIVKEKTGVPTLVLETTDATKAETLGQLHTRIEAFVEMLK